MKNKKIISIITLIFITIVLCSCAGPRELDQLGIIASTGVDFENGKILITNEVIQPTKSDSPLDPTFIYIQSTGDTIFEAFRNATLELDRKLYISHNRILIFGEEFVKRGIGDYLNFFINDNEPRETAYMLVAKGAKAYEVMAINAGLANTPSDYMLGLIENFKHTSKTRTINLIEYFKCFFSNKSVVLGVVQKVHKMEIYKEDHQTGSEHFVLNVAGGAVFNGDKLVGYYSGEEMIGFNFMVNQIEGGLIVFETPDDLIKDEKQIATRGIYTVVEIISSRTKKEIEMVDNKMHLSIDVTVKGTLGEDTKGLVIMELAVKDAVQRACSDKVKEYIGLVMEKGQKEFNIDNFDIKDTAIRKFPNQKNEITENWDSIFPELSYTVNVETQLIRTGLINTPANIEKGRN